MTRPSPSLSLSDRGVQSLARQGLSRLRQPLPGIGVLSGPASTMLAAQARARWSRCLPAPEPTQCELFTITL